MMMMMMMMMTALPCSLAECQSGLCRTRKGHSRFWHLHAEDEFGPRSIDELGGNALATLSP
jgi:hypothetical protein